VRVFLLEAGQADLGDIVPRNVLALGPGLAGQLHAEGDVAQHRRPGQQGEVLEHEGAFRARPEDLLAVDVDLAFRRLQQSGDDLQQRGLAAPAGSQQGGHLAGRETQVDRIQRPDVRPVGLRDVADLDDVFHA